MLLVYLHWHLGTEVRILSDRSYKNQKQKTLLHLRTENTGKYNLSKTHKNILPGTAEVQNVFNFYFVMFYIDKTQDNITAIEVLKGFYKINEIFGFKI